MILKYFITAATNMIIAVMFATKDTISLKVFIRRQPPFRIQLLKSECLKDSDCL